MNGTWLESFAFYSVLRQKFNGASWSTWPTKLAHRDHRALEKVRKEHSEELAVQQIIQFAFDEQWCKLRAILRPAGHQVDRRCRDFCEL